MCLKIATEDPSFEPFIPVDEAASAARLFHVGGFVSFLSIDGTFNVTSVVYFAFFILFLEGKS